MLEKLQVVQTLYIIMNIDRSFKIILSLFFRLLNQYNFFETPKNYAMAFRNFLLKTEINLVWQCNFYKKRCIWQKPHILFKCSFYKCKVERH